MTPEEVKEEGDILVVKRIIRGGVTTIDGPDPEALERWEADRDE